MRYHKGDYKKAVNGYTGEADTTVYDGQGNREFVSTYALECRKIGAKYLAERAKLTKGEVVNV